MLHLNCIRYFGKKMPFKVSHNFSLFYEMELLTLITQLDFKLMKDT